MSNLTGLEEEQSFTESNFKTNFKYDSLFALAKRLQTIVLLEPNTIPNLPECGVGIRLFLFNFNDELTLNLIKQKITTNIQQYMPNSNILSIEVNKISNNNSGKTDGIYIKGNVYDKSDPNASNIVKQIGMTFVTDGASRLVSEIYL